MSKITFVKAFVCFGCFLSYSFLIAQVSVNGRINNMMQRNLLVSVYSEGTHQLIPVGGGGDFEAELPRFEECILVIYGAKTQPVTYSINTELPVQEAIKLSVGLSNESPNEKDVRIDGPAKRYNTDGYAYTASIFNLDNVKDKPKFATLMSKVSQDLKAFYRNRTIPPEQLGLNTTDNDVVNRKSEHKLGQDIFSVLNKKRLQEAHLEKMKSRYDSFVGDGIPLCQVAFDYLKAEATYKKTSYELARLEYEKEKLIARRNEKNNRPTNPRTLKTAEEKRDRLEKEQEIASVTLINKQADCWELDMQVRLDAELEKGDQANQALVESKRLDINNIRMTKRLQNARKLHKQHNLLANDLTGRDRVVELANAQKYIAQQEEIKFFQAENTLKKWQIKQAKEGIYDRQLAAANQAFLKQREDAYMAEMAYLEHIWHLREKPDVKGVLDDVFARQNDLLDIVQTNRPKLEDGTAEKEVETITDAELLSKIKIESNTRENGRSKTLTFEQDYYEIIEYENGRKYFKNGKPVTRITYEFETKRQFGQILENVKEEERRKKLWDLFKKRIQ